MFKEFIIIALDNIDDLKRELAKGNTLGWTLCLIHAIKSIIAF